MRLPLDDDVHRAEGRRAGAVDDRHAAQDQPLPGPLALGARRRGRDAVDLLLHLGCGREQRQRRRDQDRSARLLHRRPPELDGIAVARSMFQPGVIARAAGRSRPLRVDFGFFSRELDLEHAFPHQAAAVRPHVRRRGPGRRAGSAAARGPSRRRLQRPRGDGADAGRREALHADPDAERGERAAADPARADAVRRDAGAQRDRVDPARGDTRAALPRRRIRVRRSGPARPLQVRGRLRDVPRAARRVQPHADGRDHRRLGHDRLAGEERHSQQRHASGCGARPIPGGSRSRRCATRIPRSRRPSPSTPSWTCGKPTTGSTGVPSARGTRSTSSTRWRRARAHRSPIRTRRATSTRGCWPRDRPRRSAGASTQRHEMWPRLVENPRLRAVLEGLRGGPLVPLAEAAGADAPRPRVLGPGGHLRRARRLRGARGARPRQRPRTSSRPAPGITASTSPTALAWGRSPSTRTRRSASARTCSTPFLRRFLKGEHVEPPAPVTVFETGANRWRRFQTLAAGRRDAAAVPAARRTASASSRRARGDAATEYVSDPKKPVPNAPRPQWGYDYDNPAVIAAWRRWLVEDQRFVDGRPDVATWLSEPLAAPLTIRGAGQGAPVRRDHGQRRRLGRQADRRLSGRRPGRPRDVGLPADGQRRHLPRPLSRELRASRGPLAPGQALAYEIPLPHANHTFGRGHRLMVQVQSSWFPLYDRNPQTWVPSIMTAPPRVLPGAAPPRPPRPGARDAPRAAGRHGRALAGGRAQRTGAPVALQSRRLR